MPVSDPCIVCKHEYAGHRVDGTGIKCHECPNLKYCFTSGQQPQPPTPTRPTMPMDNQRNLTLHERTLHDYLTGMLQANAANRPIKTPSQQQAQTVEPTGPLESRCMLCSSANAGMVRTIHGTTHLCVDCATHADDIEKRYAVEKFARGLSAVKDASVPGRTPASAVTAGLI